MYDKLTKKDIALMEAELEDRRMNIRPRIIEEVKRTRAFGDLSENYEYKAAKQEQRRNDSRVRYLQAMIKTATIIDEAQGESGKVKLYDRVTVFMPEDGETMVLQVVSTVRIEPGKGYISMESPLGKTLLGHAVGESLTVHVNDSYSYPIRIEKIEPAQDDGSAPLLSY